MRAAPDAVDVGLAFCELSGWSATFQHSKGRLFLAHALHLARHGEPLLAEGFVATDFGPECLAWKRFTARFGARPVRRPLRLPFTRPVRYGLALLEGERLATVEEVHAATASWTGAAFVNATHAEGTPWARSYVPGHRIPLGREAIARYGREALLGA